MVAAYLIFLGLTSIPPCSTAQMKGAGALPYFRAPALWGHQARKIVSSDSLCEEELRVCLCTK